MPQRPDPARSTACSSGLLFSAILVIGTPSVPIQAFVGVLFVGIALGMLLSIITYSFVRRRRDFASVMQVIADHYEVTIAARSVQRARQVLGQSGARRSRRAAAPAAADAARRLAARRRRIGERAPARRRARPRPPTASAWRR